MLSDQFSKHVQIVLVAVATLALAVGAHADPIVLDENASQPILMEGAASGTLLLCEQNNTARNTNGVWDCVRTLQGVVTRVQPSDSITWVPNMPIAGTSQVRFCSEADTVGDVDDRFCQPVMTGNFAIIEQGTETLGERTPYAPIQGQPGFATRGSATVDYILISDSRSIPEPPLLTLFGAALTAFWLRHRRRG